MKKSLSLGVALIVTPMLVATAAMAADTNSSLAFLGPKGTYSEQAANYWVQNANGKLIAAEEKSLTEVVGAVQNGKAGQAILPMMATVSAFPAQSHAAILANSDPAFRVVGEVSLPIVSQLAIKPGTKKEDIKKILSHPNALKEASVFLKREFADVPLEDASSTAAAAKMVAEGDGTIAAVVGPAGAELYKLQVLADGIQDDKDNSTMFWVLAPRDAAPSEKANRAAVLVDVPSGSGAFSDAVEVLKQEGFRVVFVNSLSLMGKPYAFRYVISAANSQDVDSAALTDKLRNVKGLAILGLYQASSK